MNLQACEISHKIVLDKNILQTFIYPKINQTYYYSESFDPEFYIDLALAGFITTWFEQNDTEYLLPEIQHHYAILDFEDLYISKKVKKLIHKDHYSFFTDEYYDKVIEHLSFHHKDSWLKGKYIGLLEKLQTNTYKENQFKLNTFGLIDDETGEIIAAEIGYSTFNNAIYTSLSGFSKREKKYNNFGTLQLVLLAKYLEQEKYSFWNLGHPYMEYKFKLGAKVLTREEFLNKPFC